MTIHHELSLERISSPCSPSMCSDVHINRFGVMPKNYQQDKWQLIPDLSHPSGSSVNDGISSQLSSLTYVCDYDAILNILKSGKIQNWQRLPSKVPFVYYQRTQQINIYSG